MEPTPEPDSLQNRRKGALYLALTIGAMIIAALWAEPGRKLDFVFIILLLFFVPALMAIILRRVRPRTFAAIAVVSCLVAAALTAVDAVWYATAPALVFAGF